MSQQCGEIVFHIIIFVLFQSAQLCEEAHYSISNKSIQQITFKTNISIISNNFNLSGCTTFLFVHQMEFDKTSGPAYGLLTKTVHKILLGGGKAPGDG